MSHLVSKKEPKYSYDKIIINTSHLVSNGRYTYRFPKAVSFTNSKIALTDIAIYNSSCNIAPEYNNNTYSIIWRGTTYNYTIPSGYYTCESFNALLQFNMISNKLYCLTGTGNDQQYVFFINIQVNEVQYKNQIDISYIPTSSEASSLSYSIPADASWTFPTTRQTPQLVLSAGLQKLFGYGSQTTFPDSISTSNQTFLSTSTPTISTVFCYIFTCNLVTSKFNNVPNVLYQLPLTAGFGSLITRDNMQGQYYQIRDGIYSEIEIQIWDQYYNLINFRDQELILSLTIETLE
jgi:hypothetical protein